MFEFQTTDLEREFDDTVSSNNKSKSDVIIPIAEPQYTGNQISFLRYNS